MRNGVDAQFLDTTVSQSRLLNQYLGIRYIVVKQRGGGEGGGGGCGGGGCEAYGGGAGA